MKKVIEVLKINKKALPIIFLFVSCCLSLVTVANAQFELPSIRSIKPVIILNSDPVTPLPNSTVAITANLSGVIGAGNPNYAWFLNGIRQTEASGLNKNIFSFKTGAIGTTYRISVNVAIPGASALSDAINLTVSDVDLTWVANSQAPAAYRAKLMPTQNSIVAISALSFIYRPGTKNQINSSNLIYNWIINGKLDLVNSGTDKNSYILTVNDFLKSDFLIRLEVKTADGAVSLNKFLTIPIVRPRVQLYFFDPETNQSFGGALKNITTKPINLNFIAQAYFFNIPEKHLKWQWLVNNTKVDSQTEKPWSATLNLKDSSLGQFFSTQIKVTAENPDNDLEMGQSIINLEVQ